MSDIVRRAGVHRLTTARRMLTGPKRPDRASRPDGRTLRPRGFSDDYSSVSRSPW
ncbi:hypothetical protein I552_2328 [Mycobacterium xenopi 3993]|nr:hypothetical protein I552_2328 [Mycobacterium xenopi 3993]